VGLSLPQAALRRATVTTAAHCIRTVRFMTYLPWNDRSRLAGGRRGGCAAPHACDVAHAKNGVRARAARAAKPL
jgi:hypothetical protein